MRFGARRPALAAAVFALILGGCGGGHPAANGAGFDGATLPPGLRARGFTLTDQSGRSVSLSAYRGHVVVLVFLSSHCRACVLVAQQVRGALDELELSPSGATTGDGSRGGGPASGAQDVRTLFVTTDPGSDTRASVTRFLSQTSLAGRAEYLTGATALLRPLWRAYGIAPASSGRRTSEASTTVLLIDHDGIERIAFGLEQLTPEALAHDIRRLRGG